MRRRVETVCVALVGGAVLFVLANLAAAVLGRPGEGLPPGHPVYSEAHRGAYERAYGLPISDVRGMVGEAWARDAWIYEPYLQFRERPRAGRFVNVSSDGFRLNGPGGRGRLDPSVPGVVLLGGSTTFGYGVRDQDTIAAHLEGLFRERLPGRPLAVYNYGRGFYGSSQELLLLKALLQRGVRPAVVVFVDGVNEQLCPAYSLELAALFRSASLDPWASARAAAASLPLLRLLRDPGPGLMSRPFEAPARAEPPFECECAGSAACLEQVVDTLRLNRGLARALAEAHGFDVHFVLQPVGGYRNEVKADLLGIPIPDRRESMEALERTFGGEERSEHSLAGVLAGFPGPAFVDGIHYSSGVHRLIAEHLYTHVSRSLVKHRGGS
jgi:hypothetical protein